MKKLFLILVVLIGSIFAIRYTKSQKNTLISPKPESTNVVSPTAHPIGTNSVQSSLFVPYWSVNDATDIPSEYTQIIYFGITPTTNGINTEDVGYLRLSKFVQKVDANQETMLAIRMLDSKINFKILESPVQQKTIIDATVSLAKKHRFNGIVLDLELSALPFDSLIKQINAFTKDFSQAARKESLQFSITAYGDTYYRIRPFDIKTLAESADQVMIMAYDLHKAGGNPGPNFPLSGGEKYGYDFEKLTERFLTEVPAEKTTVIFGLFGYDWEVDGKNISQNIGKALSMLEIQKRISDNCSALNCHITRDPLSKEQMITYTAEDGQKHTVWFEDMESVAAKQNYLQGKGITNFSYWAHSYF